MSKKTKKTVNKPVPGAQHTEIVCVIDESGSMSTLRQDVIGGVNEFVRKQVENKDGTASMTLVKFNTTPTTVYQSTPVADVPMLTDASYSPDGFTALLDAVARAVELADERCKSAPAGTKVALVVMTDGQENASKQTTQAQLKALLEDRQKTRGWAVTFLGANIDSFATAGAIGINQNAAMNYSATRGGVKAMMCSVADNVSQLRSGASHSFSYTAKDRKAAVENK